METHPTLALRLARAVTRQTASYNTVNNGPPVGWEQGSSGGSKAFKKSGIQQAKKKMKGNRYFPARGMQWVPSTVSTLLHINKICH